MYNKSLNSTNSLSQSLTDTSIDLTKDKTNKSNNSIKGCNDSFLSIEGYKYDCNKKNNHIQNIIDKSDTNIKTNLSDIKLNIDCNFKQINLSFNDNINSLKLINDKLNKENIGEILNISNVSNDIDSNSQSVLEQNDEDEKIIKGDKRKILLSKSSTGSLINRSMYSKDASNSSLILDDDIIDNDVNTKLNNSIMKNKDYNDLN